jgi:hypothetical protein
VAGLPKLEKSAKMAIRQLKNGAIGAVSFGLEAELF